VIWIPISLGSAQWPFALFPFYRSLGFIPSVLLVMFFFFSFPFSLIFLFHTFFFTFSKRDYFPCFFHERFAQLVVVIGFYHLSLVCVGVPNVCGQITRKGAK
jgi:hypothetical protein